VEIAISSVPAQLGDWGDQELLMVNRVSFGEAGQRVKENKDNLRPAGPLYERYHSYL
jgi:hypothetical protein